jgi:hypothetical protein
MAGRKKNITDNKTLSISLPAEAYDYLSLLAGLGRLGASESEVASFLVTREVDLMLVSDYHLKKIG